MGYKISPSRINLLENCERCFWLDVVKKIKRPSTGFPTLPLGIHEMLKEHFDRFRDTGELPPELKKENINVGLFQDRELLNIWRNVRKGIEYKDEDNGITLMGAVDDILQNENKLIVLDHKTKGFSINDESSHPYIDQLTIYNFLLRKNGFETEDYAYLLFYVPEKINKEGDLIFDTKLVKININIEHAEYLFKKAIEVLKLEEAPNPSSNCEYCLWAKGIVEV